VDSEQTRGGFRTNTRWIQNEHEVDSERTRGGFRTNTRWIQKSELSLILGIFWLLYSSCYWYDKSEWNALMVVLLLIFGAIVYVNFSKFLFLQVFSILVSWLVMSAEISVVIMIVALFLWCCCFSSCFGSFWILCLKLCIIWLSCKRLTSPMRFATEMKSSQRSDAPSRCRCSRVAV
jgi:hypothetical protein